MQIIPAIMPMSIDELSAYAAGLVSFARELQLDVTDGEFVPKAGWPCASHEQWRELEAIAGPAGSGLPERETISWEVHLMAAEPARIGELFARAGALRIIGHIEAMSADYAVRDIFDAWRNAGAKEVGLSILLDTPLSALENIADKCDVVQVMGIEKIGVQGEPFSMRALERVREIHAAYPKLVIAVDGGIHENNAGAIAAAGATRLVVGSAILESGHPAQAYATILSAAEDSAHAAPAADSTPLFS